MKIQNLFNNGLLLHHDTLIEPHGRVIATFEPDVIYEERQAIADAFDVIQDLTEERDTLSEQIGDPEKEHKEEIEELNEKISKLEEDLEKESTRASDLATRCHNLQIQVNDGAPAKLEALRKNFEMVQDSNSELREKIWDLETELEVNRLTTSDLRELVEKLQEKNGTLPRPRVTNGNGTGNVVLSLDDF